jgi:hypothetical protein
MIVHARRAELLDRIHRGEAFLTRLEGEWAVRFSARDQYAEVGGAQAPMPDPQSQAAD